MLTMGLAFFKKAITCNCFLVGMGVMKENHPILYKIQLKMFFLSFEDDCVATQKDTHKSR